MIKLASKPHCRWSINGRFLKQNVTGVQRYATQLTRSLEKTFADHNDSDSLEVVAPSQTPCPTFTRLPFRETGRRQGQLWEQYSLPRSTSGGILSLCNTGPIVSRKHIVCIHDTNVVLYPQSYSRAFRNYYRMILPVLGRTASAVLTVSKTSADMLMTHGIVKSKKIEVIPNGHQHVFDWDASKSTLLKDHPPRQPFVFVIGSRAPHKNLALIYKIAPALEKMGLDIYISGASASIFSSSSMSGSGKAQQASNVQHVGYVSDDDLADLYSTAKCLLFPSFVEGFGLPLVEAMAMGCPIVSSNTSCMPEICGPHAVLVPPDSPQQWVAGIKTLLDRNEKTPQNELIKHLESFSWKRSAETLHELMTDL